MREQAFVAFRSVADASAAMRAEGGREFFGREMVGAGFCLCFYMLARGRERGRGRGGEEEEERGRGKRWVEDMDR
jgi:hypothetical protein